MNKCKVTEKGICSVEGSLVLAYASLCCLAVLVVLWHQVA